MTTADSRIFSRFPFGFMMPYFLRAELKRNSTFGPFRGVLRRLAHFSAVQIGTVLQVARMRGHHHIGHAEEMPSNNRGNLKAIEVLPLHLGQNPLQRALHL